jgi:hypothetical protein
MAVAAEDDPDGGLPLHGGSPSLLDVLPMDRGEGYVVDEARARDSACLCRQLRQGGDICFSHGIVGPLSEEQRTLYCGAGEEPLELTDAQQARLDLFAETAHACSAELAGEPKGSRFPSYLTCMERELKRREPPPAATP